MDCGVPRLKRSSTESRVASPSAAKAAARLFKAVERLGGIREKPFDIVHLDCPAALVHAERLVATVGGQFVEARLDDTQARPALGRLKHELDQRRRLLGIILARLDRVGVPGEREQPLGLDLLHGRLPAQVLTARIGHPAARHLPRHERPFEFGTEPGPEFAIVCQRPPDAGHRRLELDGLLDAITHDSDLHLRPPNSYATSWLPVAITQVATTCNHFIAYFSARIER